MLMLLCVFVFYPLSAQESFAVLHRIDAQRDLFGMNSLQPSESLDFLRYDDGNWGKKNVGLAVLYSLLLPGMGELYVGEYGLGKYFTIGEGALWLTYSSFEFYGGWLRDDARQYAVSHAGVDIDGKGDQYFVDIGNFLNISEYNEKKLLDRDINKLYDVNSAFNWQWDSDANRAAYRSMRISHDRVFNNARFVAAAIIVNHIASAVNAGRLAIAHNQNVAESGSIGVHASILGSPMEPDGILLTFSKNF